MKISEKAHGKNDPEYATTLNNLASLYKLRHKYSRAELLYKQALSIRENVLGPNHPDVAISLSNIATLYYSQGKHAMAEQLYKEALAILEKTLDPGHPDIATLLNNLVALYNAQGNNAKANHYHERLQSTWDSALKSGSHTSPGFNKAKQVDGPQAKHVYSSMFSRAFHRPDCDKLRSNADDIIDFQCREQAIQDGAIPCDKCNP